MKKRSKAGRETTSRRPRRTPKPERGNAPKGQARIKSIPAVEATELARLTHELTNERRQRTAISEVLHLLSGSHGDLSRLFDTILTNAINLCQANFGTLCRVAAGHCWSAGGNPRLTIIVTRPIRSLSARKGLCCSPWCRKARACMRDVDLLVD
jgi:hypothetical protein